MDKQFIGVVENGNKILFMRYTFDSTRKPYRELYKNKNDDDLKEMYYSFYSEYKECVDSKRKVELRARLGAIEELLINRNSKIEKQLVNEKTDSGEVALLMEEYKLLSTHSLKLQHHVLRGEYFKTAIENVERRAKLFASMTAIHEVLSERTQRELEAMGKRNAKRYC